GRRQAARREPPADRRRSSRAGEGATPRRGRTGSRRCRTGWPWIGRCTRGPHLRRGRPEGLDTAGRRTPAGRTPEPGRSPPAGRRTAPGVSWVKDQSVGAAPANTPPSAIASTGPAARGTLTLGV